MQTSSWDYFGYRIPASVKLITEWPQSKQAPTFSIPHGDEITVLYTTKEKKERKKRPAVSFSFPRRVIKAYFSLPSAFQIWMSGFFEECCVKDLG